MSLQLADVLQEAREEVQKDHQNKMEMLRLDHVAEMNNIRQKYRDEVGILMATGCRKSGSWILDPDLASYTGFRSLLGGRVCRLQCRKREKVCWLPILNNWRAFGFSLTSR